MDNGPRERLIVLNAQAASRAADPAALDESLARLDPLGVLEIHGLSAAEVERLAEQRAFTETEPSAAGAILRLGRSPLPALRDWSDLEPPEPAERVLSTSARLAPGEVLLARVPRLPRMLAPHLDARGVEWAAEERPDGTALVWVKGPA